jgi:hypothetical protein
METTKNNGQLRPLISQTENNTTLWIGHSNASHNDHVCGQTFTCPATGLLDNIQVYAATVQRPGEFVLTVHAFDNTTKTWGPALATSQLPLDKKDNAHWIRFGLEHLSLNKDATYGFRLQSKDGFLGLGEAASKAHQPFTFGCAWNADEGNGQGRYFRYFSLAFKVEMCA